MAWKYLFLRVLVSFRWEGVGSFLLLLEAEWKARRSELSWSVHHGFDWKEGHFFGVWLRRRVDTIERYRSNQDESE